MPDNYGESLLFKTFFFSFLLNAMIVIGREGQLYAKLKSFFYLNDA